MRQEIKYIYKFNEAPDDLKEKILNKWRENYSGEDLRFEYEHLEDCLKDGNNYFKHMSESYALEHDLGAVYGLAQLDGIERVEIESCDYYRGYCRVDLGLDMNKLIQFAFSCPDNFTKTVREKLKVIKWCFDRDIMFINNAGTISNESSYKSKLSNLLDSFEEELGDLEKELTNDIQNHIVSYLRRSEEYLLSDEAIAETIESNDYEFNENGEIAK